MDAVVAAKAVGMLESEGVGEEGVARRSCTTRDISSSCFDRAVDMAAEDARASLVSDWTVTAMAWAMEAVVEASVVRV